MKLLFDVTSCDSSKLLKISKNSRNIIVYMKREHNRWLNDLAIKNQCMSGQTSRCIKYIAESVSINLEVTPYGNENRLIKHMLGLSMLYVLLLFLLCFFRYATTCQ